MKKSVGDNKLPRIELIIRINSQTKIRHKTKIAIAPGNMAAYLSRLRI
jgi:hypothetical protein